MESIGEAKSGEQRVGDARAGEAKSGDRKAGDAKPVGVAAPAASAQAAPSRAQLEAAASGVLRDIRSAVQPVAGDGGPGIEVTIEGNGIVLSLTVRARSSCSRSLSEPGRRLELINRIAPVLPPTQTHRRSRHTIAA